MWLARWKEVCRLLSEQPQSCLLAPENSDHEEEIRHIVFKTRSGRKFCTLFVIRGNRVFVTNLRRPAQGADFQPGRARRPGRLAQQSTPLLHRRASASPRAYEGRCGVAERDRVESSRWQVANKGRFAATARWLRCSRPANAGCVLRSGWIC